MSRRGTVIEGGYFEIDALRGGLQLECSYIHTLQWIGMQCLVMKLFGVPSLAQVNTVVVCPPVFLT